MKDYTGKFLLVSEDGEDIEYFVLHQIGYLLFCLGYNHTHCIYGMTCLTIKQVVVDMKCVVLAGFPFWMHEDDLIRWQRENYGY